MNKKEMNRILKKYRYLFDTLENYDNTRELPFQRKRIDITLSVRTINKLKELSKRRDKPISHLIEEKFSN